MNREFMLRHWHARLYRLANAIVERDNPCKVENGTCLRGRIFKARGDKGDRYATGKDGFSFCCNDHLANASFYRPIHQPCPGLIKERCRLTSLYCKLWLCDYAIDASFETYEKLARIKRIAARLGFLRVFRSSRSEEIASAMSR